MTNEQFAEECRQRRTDYDRLFQQRQTPAWMRKAEDAVRQVVPEAVRLTVRATVRQFVANPHLMGRVDAVLPYLPHAAALRHIKGLRAYTPAHGLKGIHTAVDLVAAERALRLLVRLERRWEWRRSVMEAAQ